MNQAEFEKKLQAEGYAEILTDLEAKLCQITGYAAEQLYALTFRDLSDPRDADADATQAQELLEGRVPSYHVEKRHRHAWGHTVWVLVSMSHEPSTGRMRAYPPGQRSMTCPATGCPN